MTNEPSTLQRLLPVIIGIAITGVFLIGLGYLAKQRREAAGAAVPQITIDAPLAGETTDSPLVIRFTTTTQLRLTSAGWGTGQYHIHARVDGVEHMPAAADITKMDSTFAWTLSSVRRGSHTLKLGWADLAHRELSTGASDTTRVTVR